MIRINRTALTPSTFSVNIADVDRVSQNNARGELLRDTVGGKNNGPIQLILDGTKVAEVVSNNVNAITQRTGRCPILI